MISYIDMTHMFSQSTFTMYSLALSSKPPEVELTLAIVWQREKPRAREEIPGKSPNGLVLNQDPGSMLSWLWPIVISYWGVSNLNIEVPRFRLGYPILWVEGWLPSRHLIPKLKPNQSVLGITALAKAVFSVLLTSVLAFPSLTASLYPSFFLRLSALLFSLPLFNLEPFEWKSGTYYSMDGTALSSNIFLKFFLLYIHCAKT